MSGTRVIFEQLMDYAAGTLDGPSAAAVERHLAANPADAAVVARYRLVEATLKADDGVEPSAEAIRRAEAVFKTQTAQAPQKAAGPFAWLTDPLDRLVARLVFDSRVQPMAVRYADAGQRLNLTFETDQAEIDLQAERQTAAGVQPPAGGDHWRLVGQISHTAEIGGAMVALVESASGQPVVQTQADAHGSFRLEVKAGRYALHVKLPEGVAVLELEMV